SGQQSSPVKTLLAKTHPPSTSIQKQTRRATLQSPGATRFPTESICPRGQSRNQTASASIPLSGSQRHTRSLLAILKNFDPAPVPRAAQKKAPPSLEPLSPSPVFLPRATHALPSTGTPQTSPALRFSLSTPDIPEPSAGPTFSSAPCSSHIPTPAAPTLD